MSLREMLDKKAKESDETKEDILVSEEPATQGIEVVEEDSKDEVEDVTESNDTNSNSDSKPEVEEVSPEEKLRAKKNRELFEDEVKDGQWTEYQEEVKALKEYAEARKMNWIKMIAGVNAQFKKATSATTTYERKIKEVSEKEKPFYDAKLAFDNAVTNLIKEFQGVINSLIEQHKYEGKKPEVQRTAFIAHGKEFKDFLAKL
jgi:hypothetical protein